MSKPKILLLDCETLPNIIYTFNIFEGNGYKNIIQEKTLMTFAYKWLDESKVNVLIASEPYNDLSLCQKIWDVLEKADYLVAHYGDKFDIKFIRSRMMLNNLTPPPMPPSIDTYKLAKRYFNFNANRLDYLGKLFKVGEKLPMSMDDWKACAEGNKKAIQKMADYNKQDVLLLEKVFNYMLPHVDARINHNLFQDKHDLVCPSCGSHHLQKRGTIVNKVTKRQRYVCNACGTWFSTKYEAP